MKQIVACFCGDFPAGSCPIDQCRNSDMKDKAKYPDTKLGEQKREFKDSFSGFSLLRELFGKKEKDNQTSDPR